MSLTNIGENVDTEEVGVSFLKGVGAKRMNVMQRKHSLFFMW